jgi:6-phosphogluconolactonase
MTRRGGSFSHVPTARRIFGSPAELAQAAAEYLAGVVDGAVAARGQCAVALSGGHTPRPVYERLAAPPLVTRVPWHAVEVFFGDERAVGPEDPNSNYRMAADAMLDRVPLDPARVHRIRAEQPDRDAAAREYERVLPEHLDLLLLGMGADGHTASLFPGAAALREHRRRVVAVSGAGPVAGRISITPPVIAAAREIVVLVAGPDKAAAVAAALDGAGPPEALPIRLALRGTWFLTADAAARWKEAMA